MKTIKSAKQRTEADRSKLRHSVTDMIWHVRETVSYTHLDVYKRQDEQRGQYHRLQGQ